MAAKDFRAYPKIETIQNLARRVPEVDPRAVDTCLQIMRVSGELTHALDEHYARQNLSRGRFRILINLFGDPDQPLTPAGLAEKIGVTRATVTGLLDGLERDGFISREGRPGDRRMMDVRLTPAGMGFMKKFLPGHYSKIASLMAGLNSAERKQLVALLLKVEAGLGALAAKQPPPEKKAPAAS